MAFLLFFIQFFIIFSIIFLSFFFFFFLIFYFKVDVAADNVLIASESLLTLIHDLKSMALMLTEPASRELDDVPASASHA